MHPLKDPWFLSFLPNISKEKVIEYNGDWNLAKQKLMRQIDFIRTIEELWSTVNSIPRVGSLTAGDTVILARNNKDPSFEAFPNGKKVTVIANSANAADKAMDVVFAAIIGEQVTTVCDGEGTCDVIRLAHKPSLQFKDCVRIEVWLRSGKYAENIVNFLKEVLKERGVTQFEVTLGNLE